LTSVGKTLFLGARKNGVLSNFANVKLIDKRDLNPARY
jgi:hypothetical protein